MHQNVEELAKREKVALNAIRRAFGTDEDEFGATLFVSHHLDEIETEYWQAYLGTENPEPIRVLDILLLRAPQNDEDVDVLDFTLPGEITDYVISVRFDENGAVDEISMES